MSEATVAERRGRAAEPRAEKVAVVDEVRTRLSSASAAILTEYRGLKVSDLETLRRALAQAGGDYKVYKNTLVRFATRDLGIDGVDALLEGPTAIAFADSDVPGVAKALRDFSRTNPLLVVKGGLMGTSVLTAADAAALAEIPPREVLLARMAGMFAAPMQQLAGLIQALPRNLAYGLKALIDQRGGAPEAPTGDADASAPTADAPAEAPTAEAAAEAPTADAAAPEASTAEASTAEASTAEAAAPEAPAAEVPTADAAAAEAPTAEAPTAEAPTADAAEASTSENAQPTPAEPAADPTEGAD
jgi:large subunit ribosomal protein L10